MRRASVLAVLVSLGVVAAACGGQQVADDRPVPADGSTAGGWLDEVGDPLADDERAWVDADMDTPGAALYDGGDAVEMASDPVMAPGRSADDSLTAEEPPIAEEPLIDTSLTAGSVDDNDLWDEYLLYRSDFLATGIPFSDLPVEGRQIISVSDADGSPVLGARVAVTDAAGDTVAELTTYADGRAIFYGSTDVDPNTQSRVTYEAAVSKGDASSRFALEPGVTSHQLMLEEGTIGGDERLDLLFLIDATGSMADEIEQLKANMISVAEQINSLPARPETRFAMVLYRDRGDTFVTRSFDFTDDVVVFTDALEEVVADGGGDTPESLNAGLQAALDTVAWGGDDTVKLVFLIADAPPHLTGEAGYEDEPDYARGLVQAASAGVKVFPVASSGLDPQGEFVFRQLAQATLGRFVFLTYGPEGAPGGEETPHSVDPEDYDVLSLDELVVEVVQDELDHLT